MSGLSRIEKIVDDLIEIKVDLEQKIKERDVKISEVENTLKIVNNETSSQSAEMKAMTLKMSFIERKVNTLIDNKIKLENELMLRDARTSAIEKKLEDFKSTTDILLNKIKSKDELIKILQQNFQENLSNENVVDKESNHNVSLIFMVRDYYIFF